MNNICGVGGNEKRYDDYHRLYRGCDLFKSKHALRHYYNIKDKVIEKKKITIIIIKNSLANKIRNEKVK